MRVQDHLATSQRSQRSQAKLSKSQLQDDSIMGTNNSSIVSKRSVEYLYFPHEPHFFRYFVKKRQRRSPLINRGYWLRMKAIDRVVRDFLEQKSNKSKVVVNLGCGYDPLPWQCLSRYPVSCEGVQFIDIDYRDLMLRKRAVVQNIPELHCMLTNIETSEDDLLFRSDQYLQVGCDLRDLSKLQLIFSDVIDQGQCSVLFVAEVSITYMDLDSADSLVRWTSSLPEAQFCLFEQLLPEGPDYPFSQVMIAHFDKLRTPLGAVSKYPTTDLQADRFRSLGWPSTSVASLWQLWSSPDFLSPLERRDLDRVEPFDEWEEFALFANHYFLLIASTNKATTVGQRVLDRAVTLPAEYSVEVMDIIYSEAPKSQGCRRFAATLSVKSQDRTRDGIALFGGMGLAARLNSRDEYYLSVVVDSTRQLLHGSSLVPNRRMCHTITDLGDAGSLLIGGRTSPDVGLQDCWIYHKWLDTWERVDDLPWPLYRHQAWKIGESCVLASTGRINSCTLSDTYLCWSRRRGWVKCRHINENCSPVFGPVFYGIPSAAALAVNPDKFTGILVGGITADGVISQEAWKWELKNIRDGEPSIRFHSPKLAPNIVARFGASTVVHWDKVYLVGGITSQKLLSWGEEVCSLEIMPDHCAISSLRLRTWPKIPRPLLIGSSVASSGDSMLLTGGSAMCFSFGTFWNKACFTLTRPSYSEKPITWRFFRTVEAVPVQSPEIPTKLPSSLDLSRILRLSSPFDFDQVLQAGKPVIFEKLNIGPCTEKWSVEYLKQAVGDEREVTVHEASTEHMDFTAKNFAYTIMKFRDFMDEIERGGKLYLRSLSVDKPSRSPADLSKDFASISADFCLPPELSFVTANSHSSPLRISGPVIMWLHYDVMANVLCQVRGCKRLLLFHPSDFKHLDFDHGASSSPVNVFHRIANQELGVEQPYEAILEPGDVLFIPPLWLHTASPCSGISIAVNVFFKSLTAGYAAGKDVYGNRDLQAYEKGRQDIARIITSFDSLPLDVRDFYLQRLLEEFKLKVA